MHAVTVTFTLTPGAKDRFLPLMLENARTSMSVEPGCRQFDICSDETEPDTVFLYEIYDSRAAFELHLASSHFLSFDRSVEAMVKNKIVKCFAEVHR